MDVLHNFDIEWPLLVAQIVNFLIIFYLLKRFLYKPIFTVLKKRADTIKEELETRAAEKQLNKHMSQLSVTLLKKALDNVFSEKEQSEVVSKAVKALEQKSN